MSEYNREGSRDLNALTTAGASVLSAPGSGITLANNTTYYLPLGSDTTPAPAQTSLESVHVKWDSAVVAVFTIETTNFPIYKGGMFSGGFDVSDYDQTKGNWIQENPSAAYISTTSTDATTGGATVSNMTVTVAGGTAGGFMLHMGNLGARRVRIKAVVTTGGVARFSFTGKNAA